MAPIIKYRLKRRYENVLINDLGKQPSIEFDKNLLKFLSRISEKKRRKDINTVYNTLKIYFIGRDELLKKWGVAPYYNCIREDIEKLAIFYLLAYGDFHVSAAEVLATLLEEKRIAKIDDKYIGEMRIGEKKIKSAVIRMINPKIHQI
jgi:hypothetical protein